MVLNRPLGGSMDLWGALADTLAAALPVITFDPRGVGQSSDAAWDISTRSMAADAWELMDALGVPRAHVFGLSLGGMVASWMAVSRRACVETLVLASTLPSAGTVSSRVLSEVPDFVRAFAKRGASAEVALVDRILSDPFRRRNPERVLAIERAVRAAPASRRNLLLLAMAAARHDSRTSLQGLPVRALLLAGGLDPLVGRSAEDELLHELPNARLEILPGVGHDLSLEAPDETAARILAFLRA